MILAQAWRAQQTGLMSVFSVMETDKRRAIVPSCHHTTAKRCNRGGQFHRQLPSPSHCPRLHCPAHVRTAPKHAAVAEHLARFRRPLLPNMAAQRADLVWTAALRTSSGKWVSSSRSNHWIRSAWAVRAFKPRWMWGATAPAIR